jgi:hypothetical protein
MQPTVFCFRCEHCTHKSLADNPYTAGCKKVSELRGLNPVNGSREGSARPARAIMIRLDNEKCGIDGRWYEERKLEYKPPSEAQEFLAKKLSKITLADL